MWPLIFVITVILVYLIRRPYGYWEERGIPGPKPLILVGNLGRFLIGRMSMGEIVDEIYKQYEGHAFVGMFRMATPCLLIRDPDFIKAVSVKEFKSFPNNEIHVDKEQDPLLGRNAFVLQGEEWKKARSFMTPCFTSVKIKQLFNLLDEVGKRMVKYVENEINEKKTHLFESKELCTKFTLDNVALCAFGIEGKCFEDPNAEFRDLANKFISPGTIMAVKFLLVTIIPSLAKFLNMKMVSKEVDERLIALVKATVQYRQDNKNQRNDFLDYFMELEKSGTLTFIDVVAQAASFFADGFETSSQVMSFLLFELAMNPDAQNKLREEINETCAKHNNQISFEAVEEMKYLDACLSESLRKNPVIYHLTKVCEERYTYTPSSSEYKNISVTCDPGQVVLIPTRGLHLDPKHFSEPDKYIPERFLQKENTYRYKFMPFGEGPRACLGQRFGTSQIKVGVAHLVKNFEMSVNKKTKLPLTYDVWYFLLSPIGGLWIDFKKI